MSDEIQRYTDLGRVIEPFLTGENWAKLMELRDLCAHHNRGDVAIGTVYIAREFAKWLEPVYQALQEAGKDPEKKHLERSQQ